jgi:hypothetical protein
MIVAIRKTRIGLVKILGRSLKADSSAMGAT